MTQDRRGAHAVVCGASMGGLLAARVLADAYESVSVVERDVLPETAAQRRGVSQGRHLHALLRRGSLVLEELLPGLFDELLAAGANVIDGTDPSMVYAEIRDHVLSRSGAYSDPGSLVTQIASRPLLEAHVRRRVRAIANINFLEDHDVVEPVLSPSDRVTAVRVVDRSTSDERSLAADIVVDATGRAARMPAFLDKRGYPMPAEQTYTVGLSYSSQFFRVPAGALVEQMLLTAPTLERPTGAGLLAYEHGTVILTLIGMAGHRLPTDLPGVMTVVDELLPERITAALHAAEPLGEVTTQHYPASVWRRYDKLTRFPKGLAVLGDAVCSFNPVYGQGMTSSAIQAKVLRDSLIHNKADDAVGLYFRNAARKLAPIWNFNRLIDFGIVPVRGWRTVPQRMVNWHLDKLATAGSNDLAVAETFMRTLGLVEAPTHLLRPSRLVRVINGNRRHSKNMKADQYVHP